MEIVKNVKYEKQADAIREMVLLWLHECGEVDVTLSAPEGVDPTPVLWAMREVLEGIE